METLEKIGDETPSTRSSKSGSDPDLESDALLPVKRKADEDPETHSNTEPESEAETYDPESNSECESETESDGEGWTESVPSWIFETDPTDGIVDDVLCREFEYKFPDLEHFRRPPRDMTEDEEEAYFKQVNESECFDVEMLPNVHSFGLIQPAYHIRGELKGLIRCAKAAVNYENRKREAENKNKLKLVGIVKAMGQAASPLNYYFTLKAQDVSTHETKIYEAPVFHRIPLGKTEFPFFREKGVKSDKSQLGCSQC